MIWHITNLKRQQLMAVKLRFDVENDGIYVMQDKAKDEDEGDKEDGKVKETA